MFQQIGLDVGVNAQLPGIDDAHGHAGLDRMEEKHRMDRLPNAVVTPKGEGNIRQPTRDINVRKFFFDTPRCLEKIECISRVLLNSRCNGKNIRIENNILARKTNRIRKHIVCALTNRHSPLKSIGLASLIKSHHHDCRTVFHRKSSLTDKFFLTLFQTYRINDRLTLNALEPSLNNFPFRRIQHDRDSADIRLCCNQI